MPYGQMSGAAEQIYNTVGPVEDMHRCNLHHLIFENIFLVRVTNSPHLFGLIFLVRFALPFSYK